MTVFGYLRLSADREGATETLETQHQVVERLASDNGLEIDEFVNEGSGQSAFKQDQPQLLQLLDRLKPGDVLLAWELSRLTRHGATLGRMRSLQSEGLRIITPQLDTDEPAGRLAWSVFGELAIEESRQKSVRVKAGKKRSRDAGRLTGPAPWGMRTNEQKFLEPDPELADEARDAIKRFVSTNISIFDLAESLNDKGLLSVRGNPWRVASMSKWLKHEALAGLRDGQPVEGWEPLISVADHRAVLKRFKSRSKPTNKGPKGRRSPQSLLAGIAVCAACGYGVSLQRRDNDRSRYVCNAQSGAVRCTHRSTYAVAKLDLFVLHEVTSRIGKFFVDEEYEALEPIAEAFGLTSTGPTTSARDELEERLAKAQARKDRLNKMWMDGKLDDDQFEEMLTPVASEERQAQSAIDALPTSNAPNFQALEDAMSMDDSDDWESIDLELKRRLISAVVEKVIVHPARSKVTPEIIWR